MTDVETKMAELEEERKRVSSEIGRRKAQGQSFDDLRERSRALSEEIKQLAAAAETDAPGETAVRPTATVLPGRTDVLTTTAQVAALQPEWEELLTQSAAASPFLSWEWMSTWYEHYGAQGQSRCLAVRDGTGRLVGIVPLFLSEARDPVLPRGQIGFASTYGPAWGMYLEPISAPGAERVVAEAVVTELRRAPVRWRTAVLARVPAETTFVAPLTQAAAAAGLALSVQADMLCVAGPVGRRWEEFEAQMPSRRRVKENRRRLRKLHTEAPEAEFVCCEQEAEIGPWFERMRELNMRQREEIGLPSNFADRQFCSCTVEFARRALRRGWLRLIGLQVQGRLIATELALLYRRRYYLLSWTYDRDHMQYAPAHLVMCEAIRRGLTEGAEEIDFLTGLHTYKPDYTAGRRHTLRIVLSDPRRLDSTARVARRALLVATRATAKRVLQRSS